MSVPGITLAAIEGAVNRCIDLSPEPKGALSRLHGRVFRFALVGVGLTLDMIPGPGGAQILEQGEAEPDCTLRGTP